MKSIGLAPSRAVVLGGVLLLCIIATLALVWPVYRSGLNIKINDNEAWNAYWADAAMGRMPLYPSPEQWITNNYTPLSFYAVGGFGRLIGDNILAGRLVSLAAILAIALLIVRIDVALGADRVAGWVGGAFFVATLGVFFDNYVGMNDPQLLAHAVMVVGFLMFIQAAQRDSGYALPIFMMVGAGFFKHNIISLPFAVIAWLAVQRRWKPLGQCLALSFFFMASGFSACFAAYGRDFFFNLMAPRLISLAQEGRAFAELRCVAVVLVPWCWVGWRGRSDRTVQLLNLLILTGLTVHFLQRTGAGVDINSQFDLLIATAIAAGGLFARMEKATAPRIPAGILQSGLVLAICLRLIVWDSSRNFLKVISPAIQKDIVFREGMMALLTDRVRSVPGNVFSDSYLCYRAGKPFVVDEFNLDERMRAGQVAGDTISKRLANHALVKIESDPGIQW